MNPIIRILLILLGVVEALFCLAYLVQLPIAVGIWPAISAYRTDVAKSLGK